MLLFSLNPKRSRAIMNVRAEVLVHMVLRDDVSKASVFNAIRADTPIFARQNHIVVALQVQFHTCAVFRLSLAFRQTGCRRPV